MVSSLSQQLVILDPGLSGLSGHHVAVLDSLPTDSDDLSLQVWCSSSASSDVLGKIASLGFVARPYFSSDFYRYLFEPTNLADLTPQLNRLIAEYEQGLIELGYDEKVTILLHTLDWYHLWAFSLAIERYVLQRGALRCKIIILLMFNPKSCSRHKGGTTPIYSAACRSLLKYTNIEFFAADYEVAHQVSELLELNSSLPVHPCLVIGENTALKPSIMGDYLLLYCGDAKENKGFNDLPHLLEQCIEVEQSNIKYVVHFTNLSEDSRLADTEKQLENIAKQYSCIVIEKGFITDIKLNNLIANSKALILNYNSEVYQNKSSGMVWLAAKFNTPILLNDSSWLTREAERLNLQQYKLSNESLMKVVRQERPPKLGFIDNRYKQQLLKPFSNWLLTQVLK